VTGLHDPAGAAELTDCGPEGHCITCGDIATPMRVVRIDEVRELALCERADGERATIEIALVAPVVVGDEVLVHAGTAIANLAEGQAA
jgi:hydrogenase assembly chaperone HypC/HupF